MTICRKYTVSGRVQGVFYRASTERQAQRLGVTGWVRNLPDSRVEVLACGDEEQLDALLSWLWQGPANARVSDVCSDAVETQNWAGFNVRYD
jgi:acylphosphatase